MVMNEPAAFYSLDANLGVSVDRFQLGTTSRVVCLMTYKLIVENGKTLVDGSREIANAPRGRVVVSPFGDAAAFVDSVDGTLVHVDAQGVESVVATPVPSLDVVSCHSWPRRGTAMRRS